MTVGWYVHHHGSGHLHRFLAVARHLVAVTALSSLPRPAALPEGVDWITLADDVPAGIPQDPTAGGMLHFAPLRGAGLRHRGAALAAWVAAARPGVLVVDVSVEVTLLARLLGVPTVVVAQRGVRTDPAHALGYATAAAVVAPWTAATDDGGLGAVPVRHVGAISRFDEHAVAGAPDPARVLLLTGAGGLELTPADVRRAVAATPGRTWDVAGALRVDAPGVHDHGPDADVAALLARAGVVVATAGGNLVAEVAAARRPLVLLPQWRPFDEQHAQARALARLGLAEVVADPQGADWPAVLDRAAAADPARWALLHDGRGAERLAAVVAAVAEGRSPAPLAAEDLACA